MHSLSVAEYLFLGFSILLLSMDFFGIFTPSLSAKGSFCFCQNEHVVQW